MALRSKSVAVLVLLMLAVPIAGALCSGWETETHEACCPQCEPVSVTAAAIERCCLEPMPVQPPASQWSSSHQQGSLLRTGFTLLDGPLAFESQSPGEPAAPDARTQRALLCTYLI